MVWIQKQLIMRSILVSCFVCCCYYELGDGLQHEFNSFTKYNLVSRLTLALTFFPFRYCFLFILSTMDTILIVQILRNQDRE
jgi:hypothetical protein